MRPKVAVFRGNRDDTRWTAESCAVRRPPQWLSRSREVHSDQTPPQDVNGLSNNKVARFVTNRCYRIPYQQNWVVPLDNHLMNDLPDFILPRRTIEHATDYEDCREQNALLRTEIRKAALKACRPTCKGRACIYVFTACLANDPIDIAVLEDYQHLAKVLNVRFCWFNLVCNDPEHASRIITNDRKFFPRYTKLLDPMVVAHMKNRHELLKPNDVYEMTMKRWCVFKTIDTTGRPADGVALEVWAEMQMKWTRNSFGLYVNGADDPERGRPTSTSARPTASQM